MFTSYDDALQWILSRLKFGMKPGLQRMEWMMDQLGNPERNLRTIHIAGTNGKGSTLSYIRSILQAAGYSVGTFTSPYIEHFNERISLNGHPILNEEMLDLANKIKPIVDEIEQTDLGSPTEFEVITAMSLYYFSKVRQPDFVLYEVGLGGRLDSTNIIHPILSIITTIGLDHTAILGDSIKKITTEKAGIIKQGIPVISGVLQHEAIEVIEETVKQKQSTLYQLNKDFSSLDHHSTHDGETFTFDSDEHSLSNLFISMKGHHQVNNAALAVKAVNYLKSYLSLRIEEVHIRIGLKEMFWIGRFEKVSEQPLIILDGAHNPEGVAELVKTAQIHLNNYAITTIFSALVDKDLGDMVRPLFELSDRLVFTSFDFPRASSAKGLSSMFPDKSGTTYENFKEAIITELQNQGEDDALLITGSLYFIAEVRKFLTSQPIK